MSDQYSITTRGKRRYARCPYCEKMVWLNKPILGGMHRCLSRKQRERRWPHVDQQNHPRGDLKF